MLNETFSVIFKRCTCILGTSNDALNNLTRCRVCWGEIGPGKHQVCGKAKRYENLMDDLSPMTRQVLASEILKEQFQNDGQESATLKCRHGPRLEVRSKNVKDETAVFTTEKMDKFRSQIHMSKRNALKTARFLRRFSMERWRLGCKSMFMMPTPACQISLLLKDASFWLSILNSIMKGNLYLLRRLCNQSFGILFTALMWKD